MKLSKSKRALILSAIFSVCIFGSATDAWAAEGENITETLTSGVHSYTQDVLINGGGVNGINVEDDLTINAADHSVTINESDNTAQTNAIQHKAAGKNLTINAQTLVIKANNPKARTEGIHLSGSSAGKAVMTVDGNLDITATNNVGNALGMYIQTESELNVKGDVIMHQKDGWAVDSHNKGWAHYGASGIYATSAMGNSTGGVVNIEGDVDLKVNANGIFVNAGGAKVNVEGGGSIEVNKEGASGYAALRAEDGTINMNVNTNPDGTIRGASYHTVDIKGNVVAGTGATNSMDVHGTMTQINLGLSGLSRTHSTLTGIIENQFPVEGLQKGDKTFYGETNLWLDSASVWNNEKWGQVSRNFSGSRVTNFHGADNAYEIGYIFQKDENPITIDNYSGMTKVIYQHDAENPTTIIGGDFIINKAAAGSYIKLSTDGAGLNMGSIVAADRNKVSETLNALAGKLQYTAFVNGEKNLRGEVEIAEGLTTSSASLKVGAIDFKAESGQGQYTYTPAGEAPDHQVTDKFDAVITGNLDMAYVDNGVYKGEGKYVFEKDSVIEAAGVNGIKAKNDITIDAKGHTLTVIENNNNQEAHAIEATTSGKNLVINADKLIVRAENPDARTEGIRVINSTMTINGDLDLTATNKTGNAIGTYIQTGAELNINGDVIMNKEGVWAVDSNNGGWGYYGASGLYATSAMNDTTGATINVAGDLDMKVNANALFVNSGGAKINVKGGGSIEVNKDNTRGYAALRAEDGTINMNVSTNPDGTIRGASYHTVDIKGNVVASTGAAHPADVHGTMTQINLGLSGLSRTHSTLTGIIENQFPVEGLQKGDKTFYGETNLWLDSASVWNNEKWGQVSRNFSGSRVTNFHGADNAYEIGYIFQKDENPITIDNYSGMTKVIYQHDAENPTTIIGGDFIINKAAAGSYIKLSTDGAGLNMGSIVAADRNKVSETLNALAGKLQYTAFVNGEKNLRGEVEIAEGLTTSSASLKVGAIDFKAESGQGQYTYTPAGEAPDHQVTDKFDAVITGNLDMAYVDNGVYKGEGKYVFEKDSVIEAAGVNGIKAKNDITIDAKGHTLTVIENNNNQEAHAIEATTSGKNLVINADKLIVRAENPDARTEGIRVINSTMTINGDLDLTATNKTGNAIGTYIQTGAELNINGDVIMNKEGVWAVDSNNGGWGYYGASGLYATSAMNDTTGATINVAGDLDMKVNANALFVNSGGAKINVKGGGSIEVNKDNTRGYAALRAENGVINMNVVAPEVVTMSTDAPQLMPNNADVNIKGNLAVTTGAVHPADVHGTLSQINLALNTKNSKLEGVIHNAFPLEGLDKSGIIFRGETNLWLANEAVWVNEKWGKTDKNFAGSRVTNFVGGNKENLGYIYQKDAGAIEINNYSGATKIIYAHNAENPTEIIGGDIVINQAQADSYIKLSTDSVGLEAVAGAEDADKIGETLQALAKKLQYNAYANGERNLKGEVEIAEGLLTSSASLKVGNITYTDEGRGKYELGDDVVPPTPPTPEDPEIIYGDEQTAMIRGAKSAMATSMLAWRGHMAGMYQRIGDLQDGEETGVWARATGGKNNY